MLRSASPVLLALLGLLTLSGCGINNIPTYDEAAKAAWSQVENQYQRRSDLIPNLVETVKGYAKQEKDVLVQVVEARSKVAQMQVPKDIVNNPQAFKQFQQNQDALSSALSRLLVVVEKYPDLKSNQNFLALQSQLGVVVFHRLDVVAAVKNYNTELRTIPGRWWAALLYSDAKVKENFTAPPETQKTPQVKF